ncbi:MAG: hypothetical protein ACI8RD_013615, partial [Bacillariaceae sp.]
NLLGMYVFARRFFYYTILCFELSGPMQLRRKLNNNITCALLYARHETKIESCQKKGYSGDQFKGGNP